MLQVIARLKAPEISLSREADSASRRSSTYGNNSTYGRDSVTHSTDSSHRDKDKERERESRDGEVSFPSVPATNGQYSSLSYSE